MSPAPHVPDQLHNLQRLLHSRWLVLAAMAGLILLTPPLLAIPLPQAPLFGILAATALCSGLVSWQLRQARSASPLEMASQLLLDMACLSGLVFFSGGATNPLISLLLPPVAIAALTLPGRLALAIATLSIVAYSLLMVFYIPLPLPDASRATRLHLLGMWLTFAASTLMIGSLIVRMTRLVRQRDAELAAAREQALRDERIMAMGTLAAGAAHELGTPLATMALLAGELAHEPTLSAEALADIELLRQQITHCKAIISGLARRAGAERLEDPLMQPADAWLNSVRQHWQALHPARESQLAIGGQGEIPHIAADPRLEQALLNLLNNAAQASTSSIELRLDWSATHWQIELRDHGPGFPPAVLAAGGNSAFPPHAGGSGVGLLLSRSAIEQVGGQLALSNAVTGGALVSIRLPR